MEQIQFINHVRVGDTVIILRDDSPKYIGKRGIIVDIDDDDDILKIRLNNNEIRYTPSSLDYVDVFR